MEQLSILSFLRNGYDFHLYLYDEADGIPAGTTVKDAGEILPRSRIFTYPDYHTYAGFSNFFRYKLLLEKGGWWVDVDTVCVRRFDPGPEYVFSSELRPDGSSHINSGILKAPPGCELMAYAWQHCEQTDIRTIKWGQTGPALLQKAVECFSFEHLVNPPHVFCPVNFFEWEKIIDPSADLEFPEGTRAIHLWNEMWRRSGRDKNGPYAPGCLYEQLKQCYLLPSVKTRERCVSMAVRSLSNWAKRHHPRMLSRRLKRPVGIKEAVQRPCSETHRKLPGISALVLTKNSVNRLESCLQSIAEAHLVDEIVVCIDRSTSDRTFEVAQRYTPKVFHVETDGFIESVLPKMASLCSHEWILRVDDDECLKGDWSRENTEPFLKTAITHFRVPRRWLTSRNEFIAGEPWFPDLQVRLFRNDFQLIEWPKKIHQVTTVTGPSATLMDRCIDHHVLVLTSRAERERKCRYYQKLRPEKHLSHYYRYEEHELPLLPASKEGFGSAVSLLPHSGIGMAISPTPPYEIGEDIKFGLDGTGSQYTIYGFSTPEPWGTWTEGERALLRIPLKGDFHGPALLLIETGAYVRPNHPQLHVRIVCARRILSEWSIVAAEMAIRSVPIPASLMTGRKQLIFEFEILNPASPADCGESDDQRMLGLSFSMVGLKHSVTSTHVGSPDEKSEQSIRAFVVWERISPNRRN